MNKTVTANIAGIVFHVDDNAYEILRQYLDSLKYHFRNSEGKDEIIADIEARLAEIFREKTSGQAQVVSIEMVEQAIAVMGKAEEFGAEESEKTASAPEKSKRIYR